LVISNISTSIDGTFILSSLQFLTDLFIYLIKFLLVSLVLFFLFRLLIFLSKGSEEIIILPFAVSTSKKKYDGKIISDSLIVELRKIKEIHEHQFEEEDIDFEKIYFPKLTPDSENFETKISNLKDINIGDITISVLGILIVFKQLWPFGEQAKTIRGNLQECDSEIHLIALMEGPKVHGWDLHLKKEQSENEDMIPELIKNLAFMITHDLSKEETKYIGTTGEEGVKAKTWISLKYFTNAFDSYSHYNSTRKIEYLECARKNCIKALKEEKDYLIVFSLFYNIGISYHFLRDYYFAEDSFRRCITLMPTNPKGFIGLISPLYALGRKDEALEACEKALEIDSKYTKSVS